MKGRRSTSPVLYLYAISPAPRAAVPTIAAEGIDGASPIEALRCGTYVCWISRVAKDEYADHLNDHMQDLEWLASAGLRHQRAVAEISQHLSALPARFGTVFLNQASLEKDVKARSSALRHDLQRVADAEEWGIKVFALAKPRAAASITATSGSEYLKKKAQMLRSAGDKKLDGEMQEFIAALTKAAAESSPGGKASAGQPGLLWHGSFLVRRNDRKKLETVLKNYARKWEGIRRIDWSGPWPPYSFVGEHVR